MEQPRQRAWTVLLGVWALAFWIRCAYLWQIHHAPFFDLRIGDGEAYHLWARRIAEGDWLGAGIFYQAPLYPYFLALVYRVLDDSTTTVRFIQALIGAGSCALVAAAGISLYGRRGAIAGIGLAIYPPALFLDGLIEKSPPIKLASETAARNLRAARLVSREYRHIAMTPGMHSIPAHQRSSTAPPTRKARTPSIGRRLLHMVDHQEFPRRLGVHQFQPILLLDRREDCRAGVA